MHVDGIIVSNTKRIAITRRTIIIKLKIYATSYLPKDKSGDRGFETKGELIPVSGNFDCFSKIRKQYKMGDVTSEWLAFRALEFTNKISKEHRLTLTQHTPNWDAIEKVHTFDLFGVNRDMIKNHPHLFVFWVCWGAFQKSLRARGSGSS